MNRKFKNLIQAFLDLFKREKNISFVSQSANSIIATTHTEKQKKNDSAQEAIYELGMDVLPFIFEDTKTAPEREVDFLIENNQSEMLFKYLDSGYKLNKRQLFNMFQSYSIGIHIAHSYGDIRKKLMISNYSSAINELIEQTLRWSEKTAIPAPELLAKSYNYEKTGAFLEQKQKGYNFLKHVLEYLPEIYSDSLDNFHKKQNVLEKTIASIPADYNLHESGWGIKKIYAQSISPTLQKLKKEHAKLYSQVCASSIDNLKSFIEEAAQYTDIKKDNTLTEDKALMLCNIEGHKIQKLSLEAQNILKDIDNCAKQLEFLFDKNDAQALFTSQEKFSFKNDIEKNVPQLVDKYLALSLEEKNNFAQENGKKIDTLFLESLQSVATRMEKILQDLTLSKTQEKIKDLQVSHQYLVSKKL